LPDACELVVTVRVEPPAAAVIVTDDAFVVCHDSVTLCPLLIEVLFEENVKVGEPDPGFEIACDPQPFNVARRRTTAITEPRRRIARSFIFTRTLDPEPL
jgi:hypothetical protein